MPHEADVVINITDKYEQLSKDITLEKINHQLNFARQKLSIQSIPWQLRTFSYLKIGCSSLRKYHKIKPSYCLQTPYDTSYLKLLQLLSTDDVQWWHQCSISSIATIKSDNVAIARLLQPINDFYKLILDL
mgnify:CR=1 FL=1